MTLDRRTVLSGALAALATSALPAHAESGVTAAEALATERAAAAAEGKGVILEFYASWCGWCRPMDGLLNSAAFTAVMSPRFRTYRMRVQERRSDMRAQQLAGANALFQQFAPGNLGLPFLAFIGADGATLIDSVSPAINANIGFPMAPDELDWLDTMVRTAAPGATEAQRAAIRRACISLAG